MDKKIVLIILALVVIGLSINVIGQGPDNGDAIKKNVPDGGKENQGNGGNGRPPEPPGNWNDRKFVENITRNQGIGQELSQIIRMMKRNFTEGNFTGPMGRYMQVNRIAAGLRELREGNFSARTGLNLSVGFDDNNKSRIRVHLSNGKGMEIKIMPETASKRAIERLRLKVCNELNNCTIQLKEVGKGNNTKADYEMQIMRHYKILGLFKAKAINKANIDAETGNVTSVKKPWWAFLAKSEN
jgi:hypothetical protein